MRFALVALAVVLTPVAVSAQGHPQTREGFWIGFGLGYGSLGFECSGCGNDRVGGASGYLKMGGKLSDKLLLGGESNAWTKDDAGTTVTAGNVSVVLYYYPSTTSGFFLRAGLGGASLDIEGVGSETGGGAVFGLGYDVRVSPKMSLTPVLNFGAGALANDFKQNVVQIALGLTWH